MTVKKEHKERKREVISRICIFVNNFNKKIFILFSVLIFCLENAFSK